jgi:hypothetical protein
VGSSANRNDDGEYPDDTRNGDRERADDLDALLGGLLDPLRGCQHPLDIGERGLHLRDSDLSILDGVVIDGALLFSQ